MTVFVRSAALAAAAALQAGPIATAPAATTPKGASSSASAFAAGGQPTPATLDGQTPASVKSRLGAPAVEHAEGAGAIWTYRLTRCALFIYFSDLGQGLRVSGIDTGPRRHGEIPPDAATCLAAAPPVPSPAQAPLNGGALGPGPASTRGEAR